MEVLFYFVLRHSYFYTGTSPKHYAEYCIAAACRKRKKLWYGYRALVSCMLFTLLCFTLTMQAQPAFTFNGVTQSSPATYNGVNNINISNKAFTSIGANELTFTNCNTITLTNCYFGLCPGNTALSFSSCTNIIINNCFFANVGYGINMVNCSGGLSITNNQFLNINGQNAFLSHAILLDKCSGANILIDKNYVDGYYGETDVNDNINLYQSNGTSKSYITVSNNIARGGYSTSGSGIIAGDGGNSSYQTVTGNRLVNPGEAGLAVAGGKYINITNNQVYALQSANSNIGAYIWNQYTSISSCLSVTCTGNKINWTNSSGTLNNFWNNGNCASSIWDLTNTYGQSLASMNVPNYFFTIPIDTFWFIRKQNYAYTSFLGITRPVSNAGTTQNISKTSTTLNGSGSTKAVNYSWAQVRGPNTATISNANIASPTLSGLANGTYHMRLVVADNGNGYGTDTTYDVSWVDINVTGIGTVLSTPPIVSAGSPQTITLPTNTTTLAGTATDTTGTISTYAWTELSGPNTATISSPSAISTTLKSLIAGTYVFQLTVTDNTNLSASASVTITVKPAPVPPVVSAGLAQTITLPVNSVTLSGTATDATGHLIANTWIELSGPNTAAITNASAITSDATGLIEGTYVFQLTVGDDNNLSASDNVTITVNPAIPQAPVVTAGTAQTITLPVTTATLSGSATDASGNITAYAWVQVSGPATASINDAASPTTTVTMPVNGSYVFQLTVYDDNNLSASAAVVITVNPVPVPPIVSAGNEQTITLPVNTAALSGSATDATGNITAYAWTQLSGPNNAGISNVSALSASVTALITGTYVFQLTVYDDNNLSASDIVTINVNPAIPVPPVVSAGNTQTITLPVSTATLSGSATDATGNITAYAWTQLSGPDVPVITSPSSPGTTVTGLNTGSYTFQLTVSDDNNLSSSATVTINVNPVSYTPPVVSAGDAQTITLPLNTTTLSGTATDATGNITAYAWTQLSGPNNAGISNAYALSTSATALITGTYVFQLTVQDDNNLSASATVTITVNPAPTAPVVSAGTAQTITLPTSTCNLSGTATDVTGTITSYAWTELSGPNTATISSPSNISTSVKSLVAGIYVFQLTVNDNNSLSSAATVTITVNPAPTAPVVSAGTAQTITLPTSTSNLSGTATDVTGTITSYAWTELSGPNTAIISSPSNISTSVKSLIAGTYVFQLSVSDNNSLSSTATVTITVNPMPTAPVVSAGTAQTITLPTSTSNLSGTATDVTGTITSYAWTELSGPNTATISSPSTISTSVKSLVAGIYVFQLTVNDNNSLSSAATVTITVNPAPTAPVVSAGTAQTITLPTNAVTLTGTATDATGTITTYAWTQASGPGTATISTASAISTGVKSLIAGTYVFKLTVTDNTGLSSTATVTITVKPAPTPPTVSAGTGQTITLPTNTVTLTGTATDATGTITTYTWTEVSGPNTATISTASAISTAVRSMVAGTYVFRLTVKDNNSLSSSATVTITVNPAPTAPTVSAGTAQSITLPTSTVTLKGTVTNVSGTITSYAWTQVSGPGTATISTPAAVTTAVKSLVAGVYIFKLTVTNSYSLSTAAIVTITVNPAPTAPTVNAGTAQSITLPTSTVTLKGTVTNVSGTITAYAWTQVSGPGTATISTPGAITTSVKSLIAGVYVFQLAVTNSYSLSAAATVTITVNPAPTPPTVSAGTAQSITLPTSSVTLKGTVTNVSGTITGYTWTQVSGPNTATLSTASAISTTAKSLVAGSYTFQLTATNSYSLSASATVKITVNPRRTGNADPGPATVPVAVDEAGNELPVAHAGNDTSFAVPVTLFFLNAGGSFDPDGEIITYHWIQLDGPDSAALESPDSAISRVSNLLPGVYDFQVTITDNQGATATATIKVTVTARISASVLLYPDPAETSIHFRLSSNVTGNMKVNICDITGRVILTASMHKTTTVFEGSFDISGLAHGNYTMQVIIGERTMMVSLFLKQ